MAYGFRRFVGGLLPLLGLSLRASLTLAQSSSGASFPPDPQPAPTAAPAPPPAAPAPAPAAAPTPAPAPAPTPAPAPAAQPPAAAPAAAAPQPYEPSSTAQPGFGSSYGEPPPPPAPPPSERTIPPISVRVDPLNLILVGRLGFELEVGVLKWMSIESVPIFLVDGTPPTMNYTDYDVHLSQHSGGIGPLAGASLGVNFWLSGKALKGYMIGTGLTNYSLQYESKTESGDRIDFVEHTERLWYVMFGSVSRWGAFTLGGGIGFGYDLNNETGCFPSGSTKLSDRKPGDCDALEIAVTKPTPLGFSRARVTAPTYPWEIMMRFSLGVTID